MPTALVHPQATTPPASGLDWRAIAAHGIGRGDFGALVFSGATEAIGEAAGYCTWSTARKFALPDPRLRADRDLARDPASPLPLWSNDRVRPMPGVCFVFADPGHPAIDTFEARGGVEFEHYVVLSRLTESRLMEWRVRRFLDAPGGRCIALLGFGDQGARFASALAERGVDAGRLFVVDDRPERQGAAANAGVAVGSIDDAGVGEAALIATPLASVGRFSGAIRRARGEGRPVLDNSRSWDGRAEFTARGAALVTGAVDRCVSCDAGTVRVADHGLALGLSVIEDAGVSMGGVECRALRGGRMLARGHEDGPIDLSGAIDPLGSRARGTGASRWFVGLSGQSNHIDAALGIFAAREFLRDLYLDAAGALLPSEHRGALGATAFESLVARTCTGRSLGSPFMSAMEQTAMGVLARRYSGHGAAGHPIIEIGSALGGSAVLMATATRGDSAAVGPEIVSIDPDGPTRGAMRAVFEVEGVGARLTQIVKTSDEAIAEVVRMHREVGLVFIDGLHTAEAASRDFENYAPLVRPGGCIVFHDCDARHSGVFRTVARIAATDPRFALRCMIDTLAVLERKT